MYVVYLADSQFCCCLHTANAVMSLGLGIILPIIIVPSKDTNVYIDVYEHLARKTDASNVTVSTAMDTYMSLVYIWQYGLC